MARRRGTDSSVIWRRADAPTTRTSAVGRLERGEPGSLGSGGGGLHAVCHRRGLNRLGRPTFPISTTKWSSSTRLVTRTKESNVRASMRVKWKPECGAKAKMGGKWQRFRPGHRTIDLCGFVHTRVRARPLGLRLALFGDRARTMRMRCTSRHRLGSTATERSVTPPESHLSPRPKREGTVWIIELERNLIIDRPNR